MFRKMIAVGLALVLVSFMFGLGYPYPINVGNLDAHDYLKAQGYVRLWGDTHCHAYGVDDGKGKPPVALTVPLLYKEGLKHQDFLIYTPHAEQVSKAEAKALDVVVSGLTGQGKLAGLGYEWTGSTETGSWKPWELDEFRKNNPGYARSQGHVLVYGATSRIGQMELRGGVPDDTAVWFSDLLLKLPALEEGPIGVLAHPSLYKIEETFDLDGVAPGYDPPPSEEARSVIRGCELVDHNPFDSAGPRGLGDGVTLRSSNEACYRRLLRGGWQLSPYMGTDNHLPKYPKGPWTCVWAREKSIDAIYDAMEERLTVGTEAYGISIALIGQQRVPSGEINPPQQPIVVMGSTMTIDPEADKVFFNASVRDRAGKPVQTKELGLVEVFRDVTDDVDWIAGDKKRRQESPVYRREVERQEKLDDRSKLHGIVKLYYRGGRASVVDDQALVCVYAKATLPNGKQLISAPIFIRY